MTRPHCLAPDACTAAKPTSHCRRCVAKHISSDPAIAERRREGARRKAQEPEYRAKLVERAIANGAKVREQRGREWLVNTARKMREIANQPEHIATRRSKDKQAGEARTNTVLWWCPPEYRDRYRHLVNTKKLKGVDARAIIEAQMAHDANAPRREVDRFAAAMREKHERDLRNRY